MGNTLVNLEFPGNGGANPERQIRSGSCDIANNSHALNNSGKHERKLYIGLYNLENLPIFAAQNGPILLFKEVYNMLIIDSKDCENIDKALKKYKKKFEKAKVLLQLRERQSFTKPSVKRRGEVLKAIYRQQLASGKFER